METSTFRHGVASGDPQSDRVVLWTRVSAEKPADADGIEVAWRISRDPDFARIAAEGVARATAEGDFTVHAEPVGLDAGTRYFFQFRALGETSATGRTKTLSGPRTERARFAHVSGADTPNRQLSAYASIAERDDLDFVLHLGGFERFPTECSTLEQYRASYARGRLSPDAQRLHASHPLIAALDQGDVAKGLWRGGAQEEEADRSGSWADRRRAALRARWEWLPTRMPDAADPERTYRTISFGGLLDLIVIDPYCWRDLPTTGPAMFEAGRTRLGHEQHAWLVRALAASIGEWRVIANPSLMASTWHPTLPAPVKAALARAGLAAPDANAPQPDHWDGYPAERDALLKAWEGLRNVVVLSGGARVGLAGELVRNPYDVMDAPMAVEFCNPSMAAPNLDDAMGWPPRARSIAIERALAEAMPHIRWSDLDSHGYAIVDITSRRVACEWWTVDAVWRTAAIHERSSAWMVESDRPRLVRVW